MVIPPSSQRKSSLVGIDVGGKYRISRVVGSGGMGVVCEARHMDLSKRVAIKVIDKSLPRSRELAARFRREARATAAIESEHIVDVFDVGEDAALGVYMVMEYLPGEDLATRLERDGRLPVETAARMAHQLARGMEKAHAARLVHRDLKPGNVFLTAHEDGALLVKVLDFGISKHMDALEEGDSWDGMPGANDGPLGTPLYMSPEQIEGVPDLDQRSDIWSLGAVLFEALAGRPPFEERVAYHVTLLSILKDDPPRLATVAPWVPERFARVVDDMLVRDRDLRIADCRALAARLTDAVPELAHGHKTIILTRSPESSRQRTADDGAARLARVPEELPSDPTLIGMPRADAPRTERTHRPSQRTPLDAPPFLTVAPAATSSAAHVMSTAPMTYGGGSEGPRGIATRRTSLRAGTIAQAFLVASGMFFIAAVVGSITFVAASRWSAATRPVPEVMSVPDRAAPPASASASAQHPPAAPR